MKILKITTKLMVFLLAILSPAAFAGFDATAKNPGECFAEPATPQIVICRGSMAGVRNQIADAGRGAYFLKGMFADGTFWMQFNLSVNNKAFYCTPPSTQKWLDIWDTAIASNAYFWISFDTTTGICKEIVLMNGSQFKNKSAL
jgi:hypothetical protein